MRRPSRVVATCRSSTGIPTTPSSPWPRAAAVTERVRLGTGICLVIERDPITLAKEIASLDMISGGRAVIGIGAGWKREEMENHGADYRNRWKIVREKVLAMREIWREDEAEYHGEFVDFDPIWSWPKPVQAGGPPIWIGANSKWVFDRIAEYADGWMPIGGLGHGQHRTVDRGDGDERPQGQGSDALAVRGAHAA